MCCGLVCTSSVPSPEHTGEQKLSGTTVPKLSRGENGHPTVTPESCECPDSRPGLACAEDEACDQEQKGLAGVKQRRAGEKARTLQAGRTACAKALR